MAIHLYKTSTPSTRKGPVGRQVKSNPRNNLIYGQHRCGKGRNARRIITARHRGRGHKRLYRKIDFRRNEKDMDFFFFFPIHVSYIDRDILIPCLFFTNILQITKLGLGIAKPNKRKS